MDEIKEDVKVFCSCCHSFKSVVLFVDGATMRKTCSLCREKSRRNDTNKPRIRRKERVEIVKEPIEIKTKKEKVIDETVCKKCVRCHCVKPIDEFKGVKDIIKTCKRCRVDGVKNCKKISKEILNGYASKYYKNKCMNNAVNVGFDLTLQIA